MDLVGYPSRSVVAQYIVLLNFHLLNLAQCELRLLRPLVCVRQEKAKGGMKCVDKVFDLEHKI